MITDLGIDCADMADGTAPLWDPHTVTTLRPKKGVTEEDKMEMNQRFQGSRGSTFIEVRVQAVRLKLRPRPAVRLTLAL